VFGGSSNSSFAVDEDLLIPEEVDLPDPLEHVAPPELVPLALGRGRGGAAAPHAPITDFDMIDMALGIDRLDNDSATTTTIAQCLF
jgi:hypothetical protein